jgi:hypothetical protein
MYVCIYIYNIYILRALRDPAALDARPEFSKVLKKTGILKSPQQLRTLLLDIVNIPRARKKICTLRTLKNPPAVAATTISSNCIEAKVLRRPTFSLVAYEEEDTCVI